MKKLINKIKEFSKAVDMYVFSAVALIIVIAIVVMVKDSNDSNIKYYIVLDKKHDSSSTNTSFKHVHGLGTISSSNLGNNDWIIKTKSITVKGDTLIKECTVKKEEYDKLNINQIVWVDSSYMNAKSHK